MTIMGRITTFGFLAAAATAVLFGSPHANATNYTSIQSGPWNHWSTWSPPAVPGCGDSVYIASGHFVWIDGDQKATSVTIDSAGMLDITGIDGSPGRLTICDQGIPSLVVNGADGLILSVPFAELRFEATITISGTGSLKGHDSDASIVLATGDAAGEDVSLTTNILIHGALTIKESGGGQGYFFNNSIVGADVPGEVLTLHSSLDGIVDYSTSSCQVRWFVSAAGATLRFDRSAQLGGAFRVGPGTLDVNAPVATSGRLIFKQGGAITPDLFALACFWFGGHCGSDCWWVPSPVCLPVRCH